MRYIGFSIIEFIDEVFSDMEDEASAECVERMVLKPQSCTLPVVCFPVYLSEAGFPSAGAFPLSLFIVS